MVMRHCCFSSNESRCAGKYSTDSQSNISVHKPVQTHCKGWILWVTVRTHSAPAGNGTMVCIYNTGSSSNEVVKARTCNIASDSWQNPVTLSSGGRNIWPSVCGIPSGGNAHCVYLSSSDGSAYRVATAAFSSVSGGSGSWSAVQIIDDYTGVYESYTDASPKLIRNSAGNLFGSWLGRKSAKGSRYCGNMYY